MCAAMHTTTHLSSWMPTEAMQSVPGTKPELSRPEPK